MSIHHGKNARASRRERRKALRDQRWLQGAWQGRWRHSEPAIQNIPRPERGTWLQELRKAFFNMFRTDQ